MRKDLVIHIAEDGVLFSFQTKTPLRGDVLSLNSVNEINSLLLEERVKHTGGMYEPSSDFKGVLHYDLMNTTDYFSYEKNIYIINNSDKGVKITFCEKYIVPDEMGLILKRDFSSGNRENMQLYCGSKQSKHLAMQGRMLDRETLEYTLLKVI